MSPLVLEVKRIISLIGKFVSAKEKKMQNNPFYSSFASCLSYYLGTQRSWVEVINSLQRSEQNRSGGKNLIKFVSVKDSCLKHVGRQCFRQ